MVSPKTAICLSFTLLIIREESSRECNLLHFSHFTGEGNWSSVSNDLLINCWGTLVLRLRKRSWSPYGASPLTFFSFQPFSFLRLPQYSILGLPFWKTHIVSLLWPTKYHGKSFRNTQNKNKIPNCKLFQMRLITALKECWSHDVDMFCCTTLKHYLGKLNIVPII